MATTPNPTARRRGLPPSVRAWLICLLAVLVAAGGSAAALLLLAERGGEDELALRALDSAFAAYTRLELDRYERLTLAARALADDPAVRAFATADDDEQRDPLRAAALERLSERDWGLGFAALVTPRGEPLLRTDDPTGTGAGTAPLPPVTRPERSDGAWVADGRMAHTVTLPILRDPLATAPTAHLVAGIELGDPQLDTLPHEIKNIGRSDVVFLSGGPEGAEVIASTLGAAVAEALVARLVQEGVLDPVLRQGDRADRVAVELAGDPYLALAAPMRGVAGFPGAVVLAARRPAARRQGGPVLLGIAAAGAAALLLGSLLSLWLGRSVTDPLRRLAAAVGAVRRGEQAAGPALRGSYPGAPGELAAELRGLLGDQEQQSALRAAVESALGSSGDEAEGEEAPPPRETALLAFELRSYAMARDAAAVERFGRDLETVGRATAAQGGRIEAVLGHRVLTAFEGEDRTRRALAAAAEVLGSLAVAGFGGEGESPAVVLTVGRAVEGRLASSGGAPGRAVVLGLPVQLLETLLREAVPGEVLLSRDAHRELAETLATAGIEPSVQRGILTPQPVATLSHRQAAQAAGAGELSAETFDAFAGEAPREPVTGAVLDDRFELRAALGASGGTGWRAYDRELGREVALRLPQSSDDGGEGAEGPPEELIHLVHGNIARTYDLGKLEGTPFLSRQLVEGISMRRLLENGGPLPPAAALGAARQLAAGLTAAHREGFAHLRLKPENVLFQADGGLRLTDFGVASLAVPTASEEDPGGGYRAPEQQQGGAGDARSDVFACGLLLHRLFAGASGEPPPPVEALVRRCLEPEPGRRYQNASELRAALEGLEI